LKAIESRLSKLESEMKEVKKRLDNLFDIVSMHTTILRDMNIRILSIEGNIGRINISVDDAYSQLSHLSARIKVQEDKTGTFNMVLDKGKEEYKHTKSKS